MKKWLIFIMAIAAAIVVLMLVSLPVRFLAALIIGLLAFLFMYAIHAIWSAPSKAGKIYLTSIVVGAVLGNIFFAFLTVTDPLLPTSDLKVTYTFDGRQEGKAQAYKYLFPGPRDVYFLTIPHANYHEWWVIDFSRQMISSPSRPPTLFSAPYRWRGDAVHGVLINDGVKMERKWVWKFFDNGASFSTKGFSCTVLKADNKP